MSRPLKSSPGDRCFRVFRRSLLQVATGPPFMLPLPLCGCPLASEPHAGSPLDSPARGLRPPVIPPSSAARSLLTKMFAQYAL